MVLLIKERKGKNHEKMPKGKSMLNVIHHNVSIPMFYFNEIARSFLLQAKLLLTCRTLTKKDLMNTSSLFLPSISIAMIILLICTITLYVDSLTRNN